VVSIARQLKVRRHMADSTVPSVAGRYGSDIFHSKVELRDKGHPGKIVKSNRYHTSV
jgi:hypothetical protein